MKYKPALPEHNDNVSHDQPFREFILLFLGITCFLLIMFWGLGLFIDRAVDYITPEMEAAIFSSVGGSVSESLDNSDPRQEKLQHMVDVLRDCIDISYPIEVHLVDSKVANALAFPGGRIFVLDGLLTKLSSENGLAFVLAHELAHFKNRDHLRAMGRKIVFTAVSALLSGTGSSLTQLFTPTADFSQAQYSQERETLADQHALQILNCHYGHVGGATEFFEAMTPDNKREHSIFGHYFASHPEGVQRINNLHIIAEKLNLTTDKVLPLPAVLAWE